MVVNPEQLCKIERSKDRGWLFAFRNQHADRCVRIHVGKDLCHGQKLADRSRTFDRESCKVAAQRFDVGEQIAQHHHRAFTGQIERVVWINLAPDRIVQLAGVHAEVDPAHAKPVGAHGSGQCLELDCPVAVAFARFCFQRLDHWGKA